MAYDHVKFEVDMSPLVVSGAPTTQTGIVLNVTGVVARWAPGLQPYIILGAAVKPTLTTAEANPVHISLRADISAQGTPTEILKIVLPTTLIGHKVVYKMATYLIEVKPGMQVYANVTAAGAQQGHIKLYVQPRWERPGNLTGMLQTT